MIKPVYVTQVAAREPIYGLGLMVSLELYDDEGAKEWWRQFGEKTSFTFKPRCYFGKEGERLFWQLREAIKKRDVRSVKSILPRMKGFCQKNYEDYTPLEKWAQTAIQMPGDIGGPRKLEIRKLLTSKAKGRVLETMCGFNSYFGNSPRITEVVVLDFCREMLERYAFPERTRILYDLERVVAGEKIEFLEDNSFQTIGCWGSNYLTNQVPVFVEFRRLLGKNGKLLILENDAEGYPDLIKRYFNPKRCARAMQEAGFKTRITSLPWLKTECELGNYYLVEGINK